MADKKIFFHNRLTSSKSEKKVTRWKKCNLLSVRKENAKFAP